MEPTCPRDYPQPHQGLGVVYTLLPALGSGAWGTHHSAGAGWGRLGTPIHINTALPLGLLQVGHCARPLLLLELGQDGGLTLGERRHLLQHCCLGRKVASGGGQAVPAQGTARQAPYQDVGASHSAEPQVLHSPLLQLHIRIPELAVTTQHILDGSLHLGEQVHKLDVGGQ